MCFRRFTGVRIVINMEGLGHRGKCMAFPYEVRAFQTCIKTIGFADPPTRTKDIQHAVFVESGIASHLQISVQVNLYCIESIGKFFYGIDG